MHPRHEIDPGAALMLAWRAGDESAFDRLVEGYSGRIYALLTRFLGPVPGREDLVQEVFLRLIKSRDRYEPSARFSTYLYRIVFNLGANERARARLRPVRSIHGGAEDEGPLELPDDTEPAPDEGLERDDVVAAVRAAIAALPEQQRMALVLARYEGLAYAEIAGVLDSTEKAIKSLVHRARESLRASLARWLEEEPA